MTDFAAARATTRAATTRVTRYAGLCLTGLLHAAFGAYLIF